MATALVKSNNPPYAKRYFKVCNRYFIKGECPRGDRCFYRHVSKDEIILQEKPTLDRHYVFAEAKNIDPVPLCRFFAKGNCHFGQNCWFSHDVTKLQRNVNDGMDKYIKTTTQGYSASTSSNKSDNNSPSSSNYSNGTYEHEHSDSACSNYFNCCKPDCKYLHGDMCELCGLPSLHPFNSEQREQHTKECENKQEQTKRSKEKSCGVCFEVVMEKSFREKTFGILPNCNHCYCLTCIRKWRKSRQFDDQIVRACPECRITSDYICPSKYWVETTEEKQKLILNYKEKLSKKNCRYFNQGRGRCPFGNKCFYLHALPDGTKKDVGPPRRRKRRVRENDEDFLQQLVMMEFALWDDREYGFLNTLDNLLPLSSDDDSDNFYDSDYFFEDSDDDFDYISFIV